MTIAARQLTRPRAAILLATVSALAVTAMAGEAAAGTTINGVTDTVPGTFASPLTVNNGLIVGTTGIGELDVTSGKVDTTNCSTTTLGQSVTGAGTIKLDNSLLDNGVCGVTVGGLGSGDLVVGNHSTLFTGASSVIGSGPAANGAVTLTGNLSSWNFAGVVIGDLGHGNVTVGAGTEMYQNICAGPTLLGDGATGVGVLNIQGAGSQFINATCGVQVGIDGNGTINVMAGGAASQLGQIILGVNSGSTGNVTVDGASSQFLTASTMVIGQSGAGHLTVTGGAFVADHGADLGELVGSSGDATVDGAGTFWAHDGSLFVGDQGVGSLTISNGAAVSSTAGGAAIGIGIAGNLTITGAGSNWTLSGDFTDAAAGLATISIGSGGVLSDVNGSAAFGANSKAQIFVDGAGSMWTNSASLSLGNGNKSTLSLNVTNGGEVDDATADLWTGGVVVHDAGSLWTSSGNVSVGNGGSAQIGLYNGGVMTVGNGTGTLTLGGIGFGQGQLFIGGNLTIAQAPGTLDAGILLLSTKTSEVEFHHTATNYVFDTPISGIGQVDVEAGITHLTGCSTYTGATIVNGGSLLVDGSLANTTVSVATGASLGGDGSILGPVTINDGGTLLGVAGQALTVGSLTLTGAANLNVNLGAPSTSGVIEVNGALILDGNLNITNVGGFGGGLYRLIDYTGALTDNGLTIGAVPNGVLKADLAVQTSIAGQVNLIDSAVGVLQFWNGSTLAPTNTVVGGAGTWKLGPTNWTNAAGATSGAWTGIFGIFAGAPGAVTIDNSGGAVTATGLQFAVDGYSIGGGVLTLTGATPTIRVGDGTAAGAGYTATISSAIAGSNGLAVTDLGTLILSGTNTYTGGTSVTSGTLSVGADANLGAAGSGVSFSGAVLAVTSSFSSDRVFDILANSKIDVAASATLTINGGLTGAGLLSTSGPGVLLLTGSNPFDGTISVAAGTLEVDGSLAGAVPVQVAGTLQGDGSIAGSVVIGGTLKGVAGQTLTVGNLSLTPTGIIDVTLGSPSTAALFNDNGTLLLDGQLNVHDAGGFGVGLYRLIDYAGTLTDNGLVIGATPLGVSAASLTIQTSVASQVNLIYAPGSPMQFWNGATLSPTGAVVGGAGTWTLGPTNWTDATGATSAAWGGADAIFEGKAGAVTIDNSGGAIDANFLQFATDGYSVGGGALTLTGVTPTIRVGDGTAAGAADTATIASVLAGSGGLIKTDLGTLVLTGANTYAGGTTLAGGILSVGADANLGAAAGGLTFNGGGLVATSSVTSNRAVGFAGAGAITDAAGITLNLTGPLSGAGALDKMGAGMLDLSGAGSYLGPISVDAGTLQVNGQVGGSVVVRSGARLQGTGTVGATTIASGGVLAPGNSIGTITVAGDLTFQPGSIYQVEINAAGQSDQIHATGAAHILGGTVTALSATGVYKLGTQSTILTADGGLSGAFTGLGQSLGYPFLQFGLRYDADHAYLDVTRSGLSFCQAATTRNQCAAAGGAESLGQGAAVYDAIANLPDLASAPGAFNALSGEVHASVRGVETEDSRFVRDAALGRLQWRDGGHGIWGQVFAAQGSADGDGNAAGLSRTVDGFLIGADMPVGKAWRLGVLGGYSQTRFSIGARSSSGDSDDYHVGAYGGVRAGPLKAAFGAAYSWRNLSTTRAVGFAGFADAVKAAQAAGVAQVFGELGLPMGGAARSIEPFVDLAYVNLHGDGFSETGGAAALKSAGGDSGTTFATVGLRGQAQTTVQGALVSLRGAVAWRGAYGDVTPREQLAFASGGSAFEIAGAPIAGNAVVADIDLGVQVSRRARLALDYDGLAGAHARDQSLKFSLNVSF